MDSSRTRADAAGKQLRLAAMEERPEPRQEADVVDAWRLLHAEPMAWVARSVAERMVRAALRVRVAQRLKRKPQIVKKLVRTKTMRLSQMQDIGGCRVLLEGPADVDTALQRIEARASPHYEVRAIADYRQQGRDDTRYRALHVILLREGRHVEVQLRTRRQHAWAEAVERATERTGHPLKEGEGPHELRAYFELASDAFRLLDQGEEVPERLRTELRRLNVLLKNHLPDAPAVIRPATLNKRALASRSTNWLIIYNWREARFEHWMNLGTDAVRAARDYGEYERRYRFEDGYEVVLVGADSSETLQHTHAHYFGRSPNDIDPHGHFVEILERRSRPGRGGVERTRHRRA